MEATQAVYPFKGRIPNCSSDLAKSNYAKAEMTRDGRRLLEHRGSARCEQLGGFHRAKAKFNGVGAGVAYLI